MLMRNSRVQAKHSWNVLSQYPFLAGLYGTVVNIPGNGSGDMLCEILFDGYTTPHSMDPNDVCIQNKSDVQGLGIPGKWVVILSGRYRGYIGKIVRQGKLDGYWCILVLVNASEDSHVVVLKHYQDIHVMDVHTDNVFGVLGAARILLELMGCKTSIIHQADDDSIFSRVSCQS